MDPFSFASSSKLLDLRWTREGHRKHRQKLLNIQASHSHSLESPPRSFPHLTVRLKKLQQEEERSAEIERHNRILVEKLSSILSKPSERLDNWNPYENNQPKTFHKSTDRRKRQKLLMQDNYSMSTRLQGIKSSYDHSEWERDFRRHQSIKEMLDSTTKDYRYNARHRRGHSWNSDQELDASGESKSRCGSHSPMPSSSICSVSDPSEVPSKPWRRNAKLSNPKPVPQLLFENEARMLMKVCNRMGQPNEILIRCLVKKSPKQRQGIRTRFRELYDLDLEIQLKQSLGKEYRGVIDGLLHNPYLKIVREIHTNIKDIDPFALLTRCMQHENACLKKLFDVHKKEYSSSVLSDIQDYFGDPNICELTSAALTGLLSRKPVTLQSLNACEQPQQLPLDPESPLLQGLRLHGPDLLAELDAKGQQALADDGGVAALCRHLLELVTKRPHISAIASSVETLISGDIKELVQLVQLLVESPSILAEVNAQIEKSRSCDLRELLFTRCPGDTGPVISALLPAQFRR